MNRRELLTGAAVLAGVTQANAFGIGKEGARFGHAGAVLGKAGTSVPQITNGIIAANRTFTPGSLSSAVTAPFTYYSEHWASPEGAISKLQVTYLGWYWFDNGTTMSATNIGGTYTMDVYAEVPANSGNFFLLQSGVVVADGGQTTTTASTGFSIPAGSRFGLRHVITAVTGAGVVPLGAVPAAPNILGLNEGSQSGSFGNSGAVSVSSSSADTFRPAAILGTVAKANARAHVLVGDSLTAVGQGDTLGIGSSGGSGPLQRTLDPVCSYTRIGRQAIAAADIAARGGTQLTTFIASLGAYTHVGMFLGTNDFNTRYNRTAAQCSTDSGTIFGLFPNTGVTKYQATVGGNATSTDGFKTSGNQTAIASVVAQTPTFNAAVRAIPAYLNGGFCYDYSAYTCPVTDNCIWRTPYVMTATASPWSGVHPNTYAANWIANQARPLFGGAYIPEAETTAFFNASTGAGNPAPSAGWLDNYNSLVYMAKQNAWWTSCSKIHLYNTYDRGVAKRNISRNGDHQAESGTLTWTAKTGFNTAGTGKLTSTYNPATAPDGLFAQNSAHHAVFVGSNEQITNGATDYAIWNGSAGQFFISRNAGNVASARVNCASNQNSIPTYSDSTGDWVMSRTGSTTTSLYKDNVSQSISNGTAASIAVTSATEEVGALGALFTNKTFKYMTVGAGLSSGQVTSRQYDMICFNTVAQGLP